MIVQGGFSLWQAIAVQTPKLWNSLLQRAHSWHPRKLFITKMSKQRLIALSRWIHCRIVYGSDENINFQHVGSRYRTRLRNLLKDCDVAIPVSYTHLTLPTKA